MIEKVISGAQTGADRGGLDGAIQFWGNTDRIGGWCPSGRRAEDGPIPNKYPLQETAEWAYPPRTKLNVQEADGTVVFTYGEPASGSKLTLVIAQDLCKPHLHVDIAVADPGFAAESIADFVDVFAIRVLNVAGSRESSCPGIQDYVTDVIHRVLKEIGAPP